MLSALDSPIYAAASVASHARHEWTSFLLLESASPCRRSRAPPQPGAQSRWRRNRAPRPETSW